MSDNWIVQNLERALGVWNDKLTEIWIIVTQSPETFKGGRIWSVVTSIHGALQAIGYALLVLFFVILPTTNVRPEVAGNTLSERFLLLTYQIDGGDLPGNLFPSIHCYVSWLSFRGVKEVKSLPRWFSPASCVMAILIIISTQVLKQHYIVDAIAAVLLVEIFWRFYRTGERHMGVYRFFEKINSFVWKGKQDL